MKHILNFVRLPFVRWEQISTISTELISNIASITLSPSSLLLSSSSPPTEPGLPVPCIWRLPTHYTTLHHTTLHYITLHNTTLHKTTPYYKKLQCLSLLQPGWWQLNQFSNKNNFDLTTKKMYLQTLLWRLGEMESMKSFISLCWECFVICLYLLSKTYPFSKKYSFY